jgi:hypothetical protein
MRLRLKTFFGAKRFPSSNQEWLGIIVPWLNEHPQYQFNYPNLPNPISLIFEYRALLPGSHPIQIKDAGAPKIG